MSEANDVLYKHEFCCLQLKLFRLRWPLILIFFYMTKPAVLTYGLVLLQYHLNPLKWIQNIHDYYHHVSDQVKIKGNINQLLVFGWFTNKSLLTKNKGQGKVKGSKTKCSSPLLPSPSASRRPDSISTLTHQPKCTCCILYQLNTLPFIGKTNASEVEKVLEIEFCCYRSFEPHHPALEAPNKN